MVLAIIGTLSAIALPVLSNYIDRARIVRAIAEIRMLDQEISIYRMQNNDQYPATLADLGMGILKDPWGNPYQYLRVAGANKGLLRKDYSMVPVNQDYDLYSMGKDGESRPPFTARVSRDDIVRANDGQYIGLVSSY